MTDDPADDPAEAPTEPEWLLGLRGSAAQRPRTQFQKIRWAHLQLLLRDFDTLWNAASPETRAAVEASRVHDQPRYRY